ncbi:hypothetical protein [Bacillus pinisoli]|uniref:hypothetical protein n=1 Tax=Bacillus pinisoli TaxID=2901866 RepID=UPI001FF41897|nr:hypothetical protein [Bacillus pinisoli]
MKFRRGISNCSIWLKQAWVLKSVATILIGQSGIFIIIFFVGPSKQISLIESMSQYLVKGSLFLSSISIAGSLISAYFFDKREENQESVFEISKSGLVYIILIGCSAAISYAILPSTFSLYFLIIQILIFLGLIYWNFKINHIIHNKESYSNYIDLKGKNAMESGKKIESHNGVSF